MTARHAKFHLSALALIALDVIATITALLLAVVLVYTLSIREASLTGKIVATLLWLCLISAAWLFHLLLQDARYRDPFRRVNVRRLNAMGLLILLPWLLTSNWLTSLSAFPHLNHWTYSPPTSFSANSLTLALLLFGMAGVFARGVALREEQDLTV